MILAPPARRRRQRVQCLSEETTMATVRLQGKITEQGTLEIDLPAGLPAGEAMVTIEVAPEAGWSSAELAHALKIEPMTGAEIIAAGLAGGWESEGIEDGGEWVDRQRRRRREQRRQ
jgi:hypothetical protein